MKMYFYWLNETLRIPWGKFKTYTAASKVAFTLINVTVHTFFHYIFGWFTFWLVCNKSKRSMHFLHLTSSNAPLMLFQYKWWGPSAVCGKFYQMIINVTNVNVNGYILKSCALNLSLILIFSLYVSRQENTVQGDRNMDTDGKLHASNLHVDYAKTSVCILNEKHNTICKCTFSIAALCFSTVKAYRYIP